MAKTTNTIKSSTSSLDALLSGNTSSVKEVKEVTGKDSKESKTFGVSVGIVSLIPGMPNAFLGSAFRNDINFLKPMNYDKGLPELKSGASPEAQIFHLSIQRQFEEFKFFEAMGNELIGTGTKDLLVKADDIDPEKYPFMYKLWGNVPNLGFYFHNNTLRNAGTELSAEDVNEALTKLFG